ncbi:PRC-barrel domain containing protein [Halorubrum sp. DTA98]|uniref:PRC-barrel domain containing protein n=1 Tax=Halorubrum sp. DTA98 TaxID=3402163 RepID=UPI003AAD187D
MARTTVTEDDEGKRVVNATGDEIGMVTEVKGGMAYVDPDPGITDSIRSKLGWGKTDTEDFGLEANRIESVTDDEIRLKDDF